MAIKRGKIELRILEDRILMKTTSPDDPPSILEVAPREGKTVWDALHSVIHGIDDLPSFCIVEAIQMNFNKLMAPEVLKSLKKVYSKLKSPNVKILIAEIIDRLEKIFPPEESGPGFDPRMN